MNLIQQDTRKTDSCEQQETENKVSVEDESYAKVSVGGLEELSTLNGHKVLGQNWDTVNDTFIYKLDLLANFTKDLKATKRNILKVVAKIYDPLGILSPLTIVMKILFQQISLVKFDWDSPLPDHILNVDGKTG